MLTGEIFLKTKNVETLNFVLVKNIKYWQKNLRPENLNTKDQSSLNNGPLSLLFLF